MPSGPSLLTGALGILLAAVTVIGIVTTTRDHSQRPTVGSQDRSGVVLYGGR